MRPLKFLLIGDPVEHSRSPAIHREALGRAGLEGEYGVLRADSAVLEEVAERLHRGDLDGVNVTMPLKEAAHRACDLATPEAKRARSVNTLRHAQGAVEGHSTDTVAFASIYAAVPPGTPLHVLGAGGAARAALAAWQGGEVTVSARRQEQAETLGARRVVPWGEPVPGAVLVNATPLGVGGEDLPTDRLVKSCAGLIDLPYGDAPTHAVRLAGSLGLPVVDGIEFLARQAQASFWWWTGAHIDLKTLVEAARKG